MPNNYLETEIIFENKDKPLFIGESRNGKIIFQPKIDLHVDSLSYQFVLEARGKMVTQKKVLIKKDFIRNKKLESGEEYQFDIEIKTETPISYLGKNIELKWKVETLVDLRTDSYLKVRNSFIKKRGLRYSSTTTDVLDEEIEIQVLKKEQTNNVESISKELSKSSVWHWVAFIIISFISMFSATLFGAENFPLIWLGFVIVLFLIVVMPHYYKTNILKSIKVDTSFLENNQFAVILGVSKNIRNIKKVSVYYKVIEEVTDNRGTTPTVHKANVFKSPVIEKYQLSHGSDKILDFPDLGYDFIFDFPESKMPGSHKFYGLRFDWRIEIKVYFPLGLQSTFIKKINV